MICVDSSVVAKVLLVEPDAAVAERLFSLAFSRGHEVVAPWLLPFEVTNILWKRCLRVGMDLTEARRLFAEFLAMGVKLASGNELHDQAIVLAAAFRLPASYDAHYLALARKEGCDFWTADQRLLNTLRGRLPFVRDLATLTDDAIPPAI